MVTGVVIVTEPFAQKASGTQGACVKTMTTIAAV